MERSGKSDFTSKFHHLCSKLLTDQERSFLHSSLQKYQTNGHITKFVSRTRFLWESPHKLQLLPFVRYMIAVKDKPEFDALLGIHESLVVRGPTSNKSSMPSLKTGKYPISRRGDIHIIKVHSSTSSRMGFSIRGGSEFGVGVYISSVETDSPAYTAGLKCGDQILEVNGFDVEKASNQTVAELLSRNHTHILVVRHTGKVPEWKVTHERIIWYDVAARKLMVIPSGELTTVQQPGSQVSEVTERTVVLRLTRQQDFVGFNITGGKEFGLGIYVSKVDKGGLAERCGVRVGDQLIKINKRSMNDVDHTTAVQLLKTISKELVLTLWAIGKFPAYKEIFSEYVWSNNSSIAEDSDQMHRIKLHTEPHVIPLRNGLVSSQRLRTRESYVDRPSRDRRIGSGDIGLQNPEHYSKTDYGENFSFHTELFYPRDQDIIFRGNYSDNWRRLNKINGAEDSDATTSTADIRDSSVTYRSKSVRHFDSDRESSDMDMDYTTFLEHMVRKDRQKAMSTPARQKMATGEPILLGAKKLNGKESELNITTIQVRASKSSVGLNEKASGRGNTEKQAENETRAEPSRGSPLLLNGRVLSEAEIYTTVIKIGNPHQQLVQHSGNVHIMPVLIATPSSFQERLSPDNCSSSSQSSKEDSNGKDKPSKIGHHRHHRTHIYHLNGSPPTSKRCDNITSSKQVTTTPFIMVEKNHRSNWNKTEDDHVENYMVVAEVVDQIPTRISAPPIDYCRRSSLTSEASSTSSSGSAE